MFSILWRFVPGPVWLRIIVLLIAIVAFVYALVFYIYPWVATLLPDQEVTVE